LVIPTVLAVVPLTQIAPPLTLFTAVHRETLTLDRLILFPELTVDINTLALPLVADPLTDVIFEDDIVNDPSTPLRLTNVPPSNSRLEKELVDIEIVPLVDNTNPQ
jgi:hypothetical protein